MRYFGLIAAYALVSSCGVRSVTVTNPSNFARQEAMVEVPARLGNTVSDSRGREIPSQVTYDGKLIFQPRLQAGETKKFAIRKCGLPKSYERRTFGRAYPERLDDFAWENDRVAFRIYGPALKPVDGPSGGIDAWYKRTDKLILDKWYADDLAKRKSYHRDNGEGLDDYKVGPTLGAGAMAPIEGDSLVLGENYQRVELLESGPLRTTFKLWYEDGSTRTMSLDAGSLLTKIVQEYPRENAPDSVAAGFPVRNAGHRFAWGQEGWMMVWEPETEYAQGVLLGMVIEGRGACRKSGHIMRRIAYRGPVTYYTGYGWIRAGIDEERFERYLKEFAIGVKTPLEIKIR